MKNKKKSLPIKSINTLKLFSNKTLQPEKNNTPTNDKTYTTLEENMRTFQNLESQHRRDSFQGRFSFNKKSCVQRMQECNLSPFSNDQRSFSPKLKKTPQKLLNPKQPKQVKFILNLKQLQKKKPAKSKVQSARQSLGTNTNIKKPVASITKASNQSVNPVPSNTKKKAMGSGNKKKSIKSSHTQKEQKARIQFQNQFLHMMNNRIHKQKITEHSDQQLESSVVRRKPKLQILIQSSASGLEQHVESEKFKQKRQIVKTMQIKVMKNIQRDYPNLDHAEKKVICAVIIMQRLWRQRKVKQFFEHYVTPKASLESSFRESLDKQASSGSNSTMNLLNNHMVKKHEESKSCETALKKKTTNSPALMENNFLIRQDSQQVPSAGNFLNLKKQSKLNEKVNKLLEDTILSFENENEKIVNEAHNIDKTSMMKFVSYYREVKLKNNKKSSSRSKRNIFSLKESLSQKCLMQKYYNRIFSDKPEKDKPKNYELFSLNNGRLLDSSLKLNQQSSIQLFKQINNKNPDYISPQKKEQREEEEDVWVRNQTNYSQDTDSDELIVAKKNEQQKMDRVIVDEICHVETFYKKPQNQEHTAKLQILQPDKQSTVQPVKEFVQTQQPNAMVINQAYQQNKSFQRQQFSLKSIQKVSDQLLTELMNQFFKEYLSFQEKQCLVKKRKPSKALEEEKKPKLPGIEITRKSITEYLDILIPYILQNDRDEVLKSLELFHPFTYQKCHRVESFVYELFEFADEEEDDIYWNIISNEGFFSCLETYWQQNVKLSKQNEKFTNFLDLTYKVYNRCITDAFSQLFNKQVLQKICYPWNRTLGIKQRLLLSNNEIKNIINQKQISNIILEVKQKLLKQSFCYSTTNGRLVNRKKRHTKVVGEFEFGLQKQDELMDKLTEEEFNKVMKIANDQFLEDEKELMFCVDERYELNGDLGEFVFDELMKELQLQIRHLQQNRIQEEKVLTKSQIEEFLETNETLQTNYHV